MAVTSFVSQAKSECSSSAEESGSSCSALRSALHRHYITYYPVHCIVHYTVHIAHYMVQFIGAVTQVQSHSALCWRVVIVILVRGNTSKHRKKVILVSTRAVLVRVEAGREENHLRTECAHLSPQRRIHIWCTDTLHLFNVYAYP